MQLVDIILVKPTMKLLTQIGYKNQLKNKYLPNSLITQVFNIRSLVKKQGEVIKNK